MPLRTTPLITRWSRPFLKSSSMIFIHDPQQPGRRIQKPTPTSTAQNKKGIQVSHHPVPPTGKLTSGEDESHIVDVQYSLRNWGCASEIFIKIRGCLPHIVPAPTRPINSSFETSTFPNLWKKVEIVPHLMGAAKFLITTGMFRLFQLSLRFQRGQGSINFWTIWLVMKEWRHIRVATGSYILLRLLVSFVSDQIFRAKDVKKVTVMVFIDLSKTFYSNSLLNNPAKTKLMSNIKHLYQSLGRAGKTCLII